jgi:chloramphenicol-sensitive protein RarD
LLLDTGYWTRALKIQPMDSTKGASSDSRRRETLIGVFYAASAFLIWGLSPVYWKTMQAVPALEIVTHRVILSFFILLVLTLAQRRGVELAEVLKTPRTLLILIATTLLVSVNWLLYIWAVNAGYMLQASLGYYINPLVNVLLGMVFLKERLRRPQVLAVLLACAAVAFRTVSYGQFPWIALTLAFSFGSYGLIRKVAPVSPLVGLTVETLLLTPIGVAYLIYLERQDIGALFHGDLALDALLIGTGLVTAIPLLFFNLAAQRINLSTVGLMQYIAPSGMFLLAVLVYKESFTTVQLWTFALIWVALAIYSIDSLRTYRRVGRTSRPR